MGVVKICKQKSAKVPFYVRNAGMNLYSLEELAYYLYENIYLVDHTTIGERLYAWLEQEAGYKVLAERLRADEKTGVHVYHQLMTILRFSEYYQEQELEALSERLKLMSGMQEQERMKYRADELMENRSFWAAVSEYEKILAIRQNSKLSVEFYAKVWNNLGCCYGRMFLFKKAAFCYDMAYQFQKTSEYQRLALCARELSKQIMAEEESMLTDAQTGKLQEMVQEELERIRRRSQEENETADKIQKLREWEKHYK